MSKQYSGVYSRGRYKNKIVRTQYNYLSPEEIKKFLSAIPRSNLRDRVIFKLMIYCGLRICEIVEVESDYDVKGDNGNKLEAHSVLPGLYMKDIDLKDKFARVTGKGDKKRNVGIPDHLINDIYNYVIDFWDQGDDNVALIQNQSYTGMISKRRIQALFKNYLKKASIYRTVRTHDMRHTYAMEYIRKNGDVRDLMKNMGHANLNTTMVYIELRDEAKRLERSRKLMEEQEDELEVF